MHKPGKPANHRMPRGTRPMLQRLNPASVSAPFSRYSHAVIAPQGYRWLYIAGQVGADRDRKIPGGFEAQAELAFQNLIACIRESGFELQDLVEVTVLLTRAGDVAAYRQVRDRMLGTVAPASTLMIVAGLAGAALLVAGEGGGGRPPARQTQKQTH